MAKLNNESFYLQEFTYSSNMGNKGIKLAGTNKNVVLNLGKEIASIDLTALLSNQSDFNRFKQEFNKAELSTLEIDDETSYLAYPDTIILRRRGGDALLGDFNSWRVAEMSFLLPDPTIYGDVNCTSYTIPPGSPKEGTLKEISIGGNEETPLSVSLHSYNVSSGGYKANGSENWVDFGLPDCKWVPDGNKCKVFYLKCNHAEVHEIVGDEEYWYRGGYGTELPPPTFPSNESYEWIQINESNYRDWDVEKDIKSWALEDYYKIKSEWGGGVFQWNCYKSWNVYLKVEFDNDVTDLFPQIPDLRLRAEIKGVIDTLGWTTDNNAYIHNYYTDEWRVLNKYRNMYPTFWNDSAAPCNVTGDENINLLLKVGRIYCTDSSTYTDNVSCGCEFEEVTFNTLDVRSFRYPQYLVKYPSSDISFLNLLMLNASVVNPTSNKIMMEIWGTNQWWDLVEQLGSKEIDEGDWKSDMLIPLAINTKNHDSILFKFTSDKVKTYEDWTETTEALIDTDLLPHYKLALQTFVGGVGRGEHTAISEPVIYDPCSNCGIKQLLFRKTLTKFEIWNRLDPEMKFSLSGALLGDYNAEYLKNADFSFRDEYSSDNFLLASQNASVYDGHLEIASDGYIYYNFNFGIPLIDNPTLFMKYSQAPSSMKLVDGNANEYDARIPSNNISEELYAPTYSLISQDNCILKINGPANISEFNIFGKGSGYLFSTPYLQANTNNIIEYNVSGIYDNISGDLCWREVS